MMLASCSVSGTKRYLIITNVFHLVPTNQINIPIHHILSHTPRRFTHQRLLKPLESLSDLGDTRAAVVVPASEVLPLRLLLR